MRLALRRSDHGEPDAGAFHQMRETSGPNRQIGSALVVRRPVHAERDALALYPMRAPAGSGGMTRMSSSRESAAIACRTIWATGWPARSIAALAGQYQVAERTPQECQRLGALLAIVACVPVPSEEHSYSEKALPPPGQEERSTACYESTRLRTPMPMHKSRFGDPGAQ